MRTGHAVILAGALAGAASARPIDLLPDMVADPGRLYDNDIQWYGSREHLRLSNATPNVGLGKLYVYGGAVHDNGTQDVVQRVFRSDGTYFDRVAGTFVYHPAHHHIHVEDWSIYRLREVLAGDGVGDIIAVGDKTSFCLLDVAVFDGSLPNFDPDGQFFVCDTSAEGISVGWMDIYTKQLAGQHIDITDVPDGTYWLESVVDPDDSILELDETNNAARIKITLDRAGIPPDAYEPNDGYFQVANRPVGQPSSPNLGPCAPSAVIAPLNVSDDSDLDYFRFYSPGTGSASDFIRIDFTHADGDLSLYLLDSSGAPLASSKTSNNFEKVSLAGRPTGWYYAYIAGERNRSYTLTIDPPSNGAPSISTLLPPAGNVDLELGADTYRVDWTASDPDGDPTWVTVSLNTAPVLDGNEIVIPTTVNTPGSAGFAIVNSAYVTEGTYWVYCRVTDGGTVTGSWSPGTVTFHQTECPADFNHDHFLSGDDFDGYVEAFQAGWSSADFDGDGFVSGDDFDEFNEAFELGC